MRDDDTDNQPSESDTTRRGRQAEPHEGAGNQAEPRRVVSDSEAHDRHDEGAERRQELDLQQPVDARDNLAERVRATFTADAEGAAAADAKGAAAADAKGAAAEAEADAEAAEAEARHGRAAERDGEKLTPILAALAQLRTKSERARRGSASRLRPVPNVVGKPPPGRGLVGGGKIQERRKPPAPKSTGRGGPAPRF